MKHEIQVGTEIYTDRNPSFIEKVLCSIKGCREDKGSFYIGGMSYSLTLCDRCGRGEVITREADKK